MNNEDVVYCDCGTQVLLTLQVFLHHCGIQTVSTEHVLSNTEINAYIIIQALKVMNISLLSLHVHLNSKSFELGLGDKACE